MPRFHFADSSDPDMFYLTHAAIPDPFFYIDTGESRHVILNALEIDAFKDHNADPGLHAEPLEEFLKAARSVEGTDALQCKMARAVLERYRLVGREIEVSANLPLDIADYLREHGAKLMVRRPFMPE